MIAEKQKLYFPFRRMRKLEQDLCLHVEQTSQIMNIIFACSSCSEMSSKSTDKHMETCVTCIGRCGLQAVSHVCTVHLMTYHAFDSQGRHTSVKTQA